MVWKRRITCCDCPFLTAHITPMHLCKHHHVSVCVKRWGVSICVTCFVSCWPDFKLILRFDKQTSLYFVIRMKSNNKAILSESPLRPRKRSRSWTLDLSTRRLVTCGLLTGCVTSTRHHKFRDHQAMRLSRSCDRLPPLPPCLVERPDHWTETTTAVSHMMAYDRAEILYRL